MSVKPWSPEEAKDNQKIPDIIVSIVNELLAKRSGQKLIRVSQSEVVSAAVAAGMVRKEIFDNNWLEFENLYRKQGWEVYYDKPGYNESYEAYWEFKSR